MDLNNLDKMTHFLNKPGNMEKTFVLMCKQGNIETVRRFLLLGMNPNALNDKGLEVAFKENRFDVCKLLIENGANHSFDFDFLFRSSVVQANVEFVQYLLEKGVNIGANNGEALKKSFELFTKYENDDYFHIADMLVSHDPVTAKKFERDLWIIAIETLASPLLRLLMEKLPHVNVHYENEYALITMAQSNNLKTVQMLIERGADVHAYNDMALNDAVSRGHFDMVKYLVEEAGADFLVEDRKVFNTAMFYERTDILEYLTQKEQELDASLEG